MSEKDPTNESIVDNNNNVSYCNQSDNGRPLLNSNYDHGTTLASNSTPASAIAVVETQWLTQNVPANRSENESQE